MKAATNLNKKILIFSLYARNGASSRLRFMQYIPFLKERGFEVLIFPFFDEEYIEKRKIRKER